MRIQYLKSVSIFIVLLLLATPGIAGDRDAIRFGGDIVIQEDETVNSAIAIGGSVTVYGKIKEAAVAVGGSIRVKDGGIIDEDAVSIGGKVRIEEGGDIGGSIIDIGNLISMTTNDDHDHYYRDHYSPGIPLGIKLLPFFGMLILGLLVLTFFKGSVQATTDTINEKPLPAFGVGILGMIGFIPVILTLVISLLGIPLIPLFVALTVLTVLVGYIGAATWAGLKVLDALKQNDKSLLVAFIAGIIAIKIVDYVPLIGGLVTFVIVMLGFGSVLINLRNRFSKKTVQELPAPEVPEKVE